MFDSLVAARWRINLQPFHQATNDPNYVLLRFSLLLPISFSVSFRQELSFLHQHHFKNSATIPYHVWIISTPQLKTAGSPKFPTPCGLGQAMLLKKKRCCTLKKSKYPGCLFSVHQLWYVLFWQLYPGGLKDEFSYQEMITHLACQLPPKPKEGVGCGGGWGVLRERSEALSNWRSLALVTLTRQLLRFRKVLAGKCPSRTRTQEPRSILVTDSSFWRIQNQFDVIITDSSDPEGPAESLFQKPYFELLGWTVFLNRKGKLSPKLRTSGSITLDIIFQVEERLYDISSGWIRLHHDPNLPLAQLLHGVF